MRRRMRRNAARRWMSFWTHAALASDADQYSAEAKVTLMTMHAAKGLEFPLVFVAGHGRGSLSECEDHDGSGGSRGGA